jgi:hypothetical protein
LERREKEKPAMSWLDLSVLLIPSRTSVAVLSNILDASGAKGTGNQFALFHNLGLLQIWLKHTLGLFLRKWIVLTKLCMLATVFALSHDCFALFAKIVVGCEQASYHTTH